MDIDHQLIAIANDINIDELDESKKKKKPYSSKTYTTGDPQLNIDHFNKMLTGKADNNHTDGYLNGTFKHTNAEAAKACSNVGTFAAVSPDGGNSVSTGDAGGGASGAVGESLELDEAKRYVRRYYMKPQNIFCSNKDEVLKNLIDHEDEDCTIYTLNNLGDVKDVTKLTPNDIIYVYEDGILYDKNLVRIMDYDLAIKHEEERKKINPDTVSDATFADVYADRMTDATITESIELDEDTIFVGKLGTEFELPSEIHLLDKDSVETIIDEAAPEEEFEVGYVNPVYLYKELWDYLPIYKCTEFKGYTGIDFADSEDSVNVDKTNRVAIAQNQIDQAKQNNSQVKTGSDVNYSLQNKLVNRYNRIIPGKNETQNTILFYPTSAPKVRYFVHLPTMVQGQFIKITAEELEKHIYDNLAKIQVKASPDQIKTKIYKTLYGQNAIDIDKQTNDGQEIDPKFIHKYNRDKKAVRALYTSQIYYLKFRGRSFGQHLVESLHNDNPFNLDFDLLAEDVDDNVCAICGEHIIGYGNNGEPYINGHVCDACNLKFVIPARLEKINKEE